MFSVKRGRGRPRRRPLPLNPVMYSQVMSMQIMKALMIVDVYEFLRAFRTWLYVSCVLESLYYVNLDVMLSGLLILNYFLFQLIFQLHHFL